MSAAEKTKTLTTAIRPVHAGAWFAVRVTYFDGSHTDHTPVRGWDAAVKEAEDFAERYTTEPLFDDELPRCTVSISLISAYDKTVYHHPTI